MASEAVLKYLTDANRPYSCADVTVNLRGAFTKTVIQRTLDALSESGKIKCKLYGKQKVYAAIQTNCADENDDKEDYETKTKILAQTLEEKSAALKAAETSLKVLTSAPNTESAKRQTDEINRRVSVLEAKIETLKNSAEVCSEQEKKAIYGDHEKYLREYRKRKRLCTDLMDAMLEGYPKSKKTFLEELCVETDEMVQFKLMDSK